MPRVFCFVCFQSRQVKLGFAEPKKRYTRAFQRYALELSPSATIFRVSPISSG